MASTYPEVSWIDRSFMLLPAESTLVRQECWFLSQTVREPNFISLIWVFLLSFPPSVILIFKLKNEHSFVILLLQIAYSSGFSSPFISLGIIRPRGENHDSRTETKVQDFQLGKPTFQPNNLQTKYDSYSSSKL